MFIIGDIIGSKRNNAYYWTVINITSNSYIIKNNTDQSSTYTISKNDSGHLFLHKRVNFTRFELILNNV